jgi:hypothetical protein
MFPDMISLQVAGKSQILDFYTSLNLFNKQFNLPIKESSGRKRDAF